MSTFFDIMQVVAEQLRDLSLPGLTRDRIKVRKRPHDGEHYYDGITVHPVQEVFGRGTNASDHIGYGVAITMVLNDDTDVDYKLDRLLTWREIIRKWFIENDCLEGIQQTFNVKVEFGAVYNDKIMTRINEDVSVLVLRAWVSEDRLSLSTGSAVSIPMPVATARAVARVPSVS